LAEFKNQILLEYEKLKEKFHNGDSDNCIKGILKLRDLIENFSSISKEWYRELIEELSGTELPELISGFIIKEYYNSVAESAVYLLTGLTCFTSNETNLKLFKTENLIKNLIKLFNYS